MSAVALSPVGRVRSWGASENEENREFAKADQIAHVMERGSYPFEDRPDQTCSARPSRRSVKNVKSSKMT